VDTFCSVLAFIVHEYWVIRSLWMGTITPKTKWISPLLSRPGNCGVREVTVSPLQPDTTTQRWSSDITLLFLKPRRYMWVDGWSMPRPGRFPPCEWPATHCIEGRVGPRAGLDGREKSRAQRVSTLGPCSIKFVGNTGAPLAHSDPHSQNRMHVANLYCSCCSEKYHPIRSSTDLLTGRSGDRNPVGSRFSAPV